MEVLNTISMGDWVRALKEARMDDLYAMYGKHRTSMTFYLRKRGPSRSNIALRR